MSQYSPGHVAAFALWQKDGSLNISEDTVRLIEREDPATGAEIRETRERHAQHQRDKAATHQQPVAPRPRWSRLREGEDWDAFVARNKRAPVNLGVLDELFQTILTAAAERFKEMADTIAAQEQRLVMLEQRQNYEQRLARLERTLRAFSVDGDHDDSHEVM